METAKKSWAKRALIGVIALLAVLIAIGFWYVNDYYRADEVALAVVADEDGDADGVTVRQLEGGDVAFVPDHPVAGLIFYPGAKVQPEAYAPLLDRCAEQGILCVLVKPLFNLALLDANAADGVVAQFPEVEDWYLAGHSMGGVAASDYLSRHEDVFDGLVLLASYPAVDLSSYDGEALSLVGTDDEMVNRQSLDDARAKMPSDTLYEEIDGGNHAYYGNYGEQAGDGAAEITREKQQSITADAIVELGR